MRGRCLCVHCVLVQRYGQWKIFTSVHAVGASWVHDGATCRADALNALVWARRAIINLFHIVFVTRLVTFGFLVHCSVSVDAKCRSHCCCVLAALTPTSCTRGFPPFPQSFLPVPYLLSQCSLTLTHTCMHMGGRSKSPLISLPWFKKELFIFCWHSSLIIYLFLSYKLIFVHCGPDLN